MAKETKRNPPQAGSQSGFWPAVAVRVLKTVCWVVPVGVAIGINLEAMQDGTIGAIAFNIFSVGFSAVCIHEAFEGEGSGKRAAAAAIAMLMLGINFYNALQNFGGHSDGLRAGSAQISQTLSAKKERLSQTRSDRKQQAEIADGATQEGMQALVDAASKATGSKWKSIEDCNQEKTKALCIAKLEKKLAAAKRRDELDTIATTLEKELSEAHAPGNSDAGADEVAWVLTRAGYDAKSDFVSHAAIWLRALAVEVGGEFGPSILLGVLHRALKTNPVPAPVKAVGRGAVKKEDKEEASSGAVQIPAEDLLGRFIAECVEFSEGSSVGATPLFQAWEAWCSRGGIPAGSQALFGRNAGKRIPRVEGNGKRLYAGIKLREMAKPKLRVVSN
jgi:hypothetical protein